MREVKVTPVLVTPPASALLDINDVKRHVRVDADDDDLALFSLMTAASSFLDGHGGYLGRCIYPQAWSITQDEFSDAQLPFPDLTSVVVTYFDTANAQQTLSASKYTFGNDALGGWIEFGSSIPAVFDREDAVKITGTYGFTSVPEALKVAATMLVAHWFENREGQGEIPASAKAMLAPLRRLAS